MQEKSKKIIDLPLSEIALDIANKYLRRRFPKKINAAGLLDYSEIRMEAIDTKVLNRPIHGYQNACRVAALIDVLIAFYRKHTDEFPQELKIELESLDEDKIKKIKIMCLLRSIGRTIDGTSGINFCEQGKIECIAYLKYIGMEDEKEIEALASAIVDSEGGKENLSLAAILLADATMMETFRDGRHYDNKTIRLNYFAFYQYLSSPKNLHTVNEFIALCCHHAMIIRKHQGFITSAIKLKNGQPISKHWHLDAYLNREIRKKLRVDQCKLEYDDRCFDICEKDVSGAFNILNRKFSPIADSNIPKIDNIFFEFFECLNMLGWDGQVDSEFIANLIEFFDEKLGEIVSYQNIVFELNWVFIQKHLGKRYSIQYNEHSKLKNSLFQNVLISKTKENKYTLTFPNQDIAEKYQQIISLNLPNALYPNFRKNGTIKKYVDEFFYFNQIELSENQFEYILEIFNQKLVLINDVKSALLSLNKIKKLNHQDLLHEWLVYAPALKKFSLNEMFIYSKPILASMFLSNESITVHDKTFYFFSTQTMAEQQLTTIIFIFQGEFPDLCLQRVNYNSANKIDSRYYFELGNDVVKEIISLAKSDRLMKTLSWNQDYFAPEFILSVTPTPDQPNKSKLRPHPHKKFTLFASRVYKRGEKPPSLTPEQKEERSKHQSLTLVTTDSPCELYCRSENDKETLTGVMIDPNDSLYNRFFLTNVGSRFRPYEAETFLDANLLYEKMVATDKPQLFDNLEKFKNAIKGSKNQNEVLAYIRWNLKSSCIGIFTDNFRANCIAQMHAQLIYNRLKYLQDTKKIKEVLAENYKIPIIFYIPDHVKNWTAYTEKAQEEDRKKANDIFANQNLREECFAKKYYEFLLIVSNTQAILDLFYEGQPILLRILESGMLHVADYLFERANVSGSLVDYIYKQLKNHDYAIIDKKNNPVIYAAKKDRLDIVKLFLELNPDFLNQKDESEHLPLLEAAKNGHANMVKYLLMKGANIHGNKRGMTALHYAAENGHADVVSILRTFSTHEKTKININAKTDDHGTTALLLAVTHNQVKTVAELVADPDIDVNILNNDKVFPLLDAVRYDNAPIVAELLKHKEINVNLCSSESLTPLLTAIFLGGFVGHIESLKLLLAHPNIDVNSGEYNPLVSAISLGKIKVKDVELLLSHPKIDVNRRNCGETPLTMAIKKQNIEVVNLLLDHNELNLNLTNVYGETPLDLAQNNLIILNALLKDPRTKVNEVYNGWTLLLFYAFEGETEKAMLLLQRPDLDINFQDKEGWTALSIAASKGHRRIVKMILNYPNVNTDLKVHSKFTAYQLAKLNKFPRIMKLLEETEKINNFNDHLETKLTFR